MIIGGLKLPTTMAYQIEKQNFDTTRRSVSGRLITKLSPAEKWKININFENETLALDFQKAFYEKCMEMRVTADVVEFTDPYTGEDTIAIMRCVSTEKPSAMNIVRRKVGAYRNIGATFEEV